MLKDFLILIVLTILPFLELRASIPYGIFNTDFTIAQVFIICTMVNIALAPILYLFVNHVMHFFLRIKFVEKIYYKVVERTQKKIHPYVEKYGILGMAIAIGIPLPGSGVYSGALGAYLLGFKFRDYLIAAIIGVLIAGLVVLIISVTGSEAFSFMIKRI
ncbi:MAG: small multi-drug export protein [archaeon]